MFSIKTLNSISPKGMERLPSSLFQTDNEAETPDGILVRSANMLEAELPSSLLAVARAGAGTNNIPVQRCTEKGIVVFNTPGANANAVKELVLGALVLASRSINGGIEWAKTLAGEGEEVPKLVEKGKGKFVGPELAGKTLGVIGLGAIGVKVANMATHLDMEVLGYDPFISVESAWSLSRSVKHCVNLSDIINGCDYITLHLPVNKDTKNFINAEVLGQTKQGVRILNFARGELVDDAAILASLKNGHVGAYVTDFPNAGLIGQPGVLCIPHLGASTPESEDNCAVMAADQLKDYLLNGNITNSVNLPSVTMPRAGNARFCVVHKNVQGTLAALTGILNGAGLNIENLTNKSKGDYAYTLMDVSGTAEQQVSAALEAVEGVVRVRVL
ncbi:MAG: phosphoglycerate dehydrogenase [Oscillospiraceae bacterium]